MKKIATHLSTNIHMMNTENAITVITGTNHVAMRSAIAWDLGFVSSAFSTNVAMLLMVFSWGSLVSATISVPLPLFVPACTREPFPFATGKVSPVIIDSSTSEPPCITVPSVTIRVSGKTLNASPYCSRRASIKRVFSPGVSEDKTRCASST